MLILGYEAVEEAFMNEAQIPAALHFVKDTLPYFGRVVISMTGQEHRLNRALFGSPLMSGARRSSGPCRSNRGIPAAGIRIQGALQRGPAALPVIFDHLRPPPV